jgi:hypothetical protein
MRPSPLTRRISAALAFAIVLTSQLAAQTDTAQLPTPVRSDAKRFSRTGSIGQTSSATVEGHALNSTNSPLPRARVRLRDARTGRIVAEQLTSDNGAFTFGSLDTGLFVVELVGQDNFVLAASPLVQSNPGQTAMTVVRLPSRKTQQSAGGAHSVSLAATIISAAAAAGVLAMAATGRDVTGQR